MMTRSFSAVACVVAFIGAPALLFHNELTKSVPAADAALPASPKTIRLWFAEKVEPKFSSITLQKPDSTKIEIGKPQATDDPKSIVSEVPTALPAGAYVIRWRTAGTDGHAVRGSFKFSVK
ncbi:MAG: copper resistance protein CopC [Gemmatimonadetes bacterium]|nr:copper resistance protein CopC [Gemmatimonadota bacterium]